LSKALGYCNIPLDDRLAYGHYLEQLTLPLFLKIADEVGQALATQSFFVLSRYERQF
jgi:hypothetical protein